MMLIMMIIIVMFYYFILALEKGHYSETDLKKIKSMVPKAVEKYIDGKFVHELLL